VKELRNHFLAAAALAQNQDGNVVLGDFLNLLAEGEHRRARGHEDRSVAEHFRRSIEVMVDGNVGRIFPTLARLKERFLLVSCHTLIRGTCGLDSHRQFLFS
jgi:hypothetical protein